MSEHNNPDWTYEAPSMYYIALRTGIEHKHTQKQYEINCVCAKASFEGLPDWHASQLVADLTIKEDQRLYHCRKPSWWEGVASNNLITNWIMRGW